MSKITNVTMNDAIKHETIRVLSADGEQLGVMTTTEALKLAQNEDLDLIEISPNANPPVCKIIDYGKYKYEMERKEKEAKKKQKSTETKEIHFSAGIDKNDLNTKLNQTKKMLEKGNRVKVVLQLYGRELSHLEYHKPLLERFVESLNEVAVCDKGIKVEGKNLVAVLTKK